MTSEERRRAEEMLRSAGAEEIDDERYAMTQQQLTLLGGLVGSLPLRAFVRAIQRTDAVAPMLDPTLYMRGADRMNKVGALASALLKFQEEVLKQVRETLDRDKSSAGGG
jgi:hypothetical protein